MCVNLDYFRSGRFGLGSGRTFKALSNFVIDIECEVESREGGIMGYFCTVTLYDGKDLGYVNCTCGHSICQ